ncbi:MAG: hypothetical protein FJW39_32115 [Acidobacteria bacterium]|nr:hypothetical protein [Acidobacteriota bacterium]
MRIVRLVLDWFGNLFSAGLNVFLFGLGAVGKLTGTANFSLEMVPWWTGAALINVLFWGGLFGIVATALAASGKFRWPLVLWTFALFATMAWGFYGGNYKFDGVQPFKDSMNLVLAQFTAFMGSLSQALRKKT